MKKLATLVLLCCFAGLLHAQLTITSTNITASRCYNDGSLAVNASGGVIPYTYTIINGPSLQGVTYPFAADSGNVFLNLAAGTYTVQVTDGNGASVTQQVVIPGNYQFPQTTVTVSGDTIKANPTLGRPPYTYAISTNGPNGPFSPYQSSPFFPDLCSGTYFVRVKDSCENFYTTTAVSVSLTPLGVLNQCGSGNGADTLYLTATGGKGPYLYGRKVGNTYVTNSTGIFPKPVGPSCADTVFVIGGCGDTVTAAIDCHPLGLTYCSSFSDSTIDASVKGGQGPFTYNYYVDSAGVWVLRRSQSSPNFTNLPYYNTNGKVMVEVVDACGRKTTGTIQDNSFDTYLVASLTTKCPFDSNAYIFGYSGAKLPITFECLTCSPPQTGVFNGNTNQPIFTNIDTGTYMVRITDSCGETRTIPIQIRLAPVFLGHVYTACNDIRAYAANAQGNLPGGQFTLYGPNGQIIDSNSTGIFTDLPPGTYTYSVDYQGCQRSSLSFTVPFFGTPCVTPYFDTLCRQQLLVNFSASSDYAETYSLLDSLGNRYYETPPGPANGANFSVPPGNYQLISDSGCTKNVSFDHQFTLAENHGTNCLNESYLNVIAAHTSSSTFCGGGVFTKIYLSDSTGTRIDSSTTGSFDQLPPGNYVVSAYYNSTTVLLGNTAIPNGNRYCLLDSLHVNITDHSVPAFITGNVNVCGPTALGNVPFIITGGFAPYYITINSQISITTDSAAGVVPNVPVGTYTMIVSDSCGISSSQSVSVVDSCIDCQAVKALFSLADTTICAGDTVQLNNTYTAGTSYLWRINGIGFSQGPNAKVVFDSAGTYTIKCVVNYFFCRDSFELTVTVPPPPQLELGPDRIFCDNVNLRLSSGVSTTLWSTGVTDSAITVTARGLYWGRVTTQCGTDEDSLTITVNQSPVINLGNDTILCNGDTIVLLLPPGNDAYVWNTGSTDDYLVVGQAGDYAVTVTKDNCSTTDIIRIEEANVNPILLPADTLLCIGAYIILTPSNGDNPLWQDGSQSGNYTVADSGIYWVTVSTICGQFSDTIDVKYELCDSRIQVPSAFTPNGDGVNDYFTVFGIGIRKYDIRIFNRWGELVYQSSDPGELNHLDKGWNGTHKGQLQTTATFVYYIAATGWDEKFVEKKGNLTLIR